MSACSVFVSLQLKNNSAWTLPACSFILFKRLTLIGSKTSSMTRMLAAIMSNTCSDSTSCHHPVEKTPSPSSPQWLFPCSRDSDLATFCSFYQSNPSAKHAVCPVCLAQLDGCYPLQLQHTHITANQSVSRSDSLPGETPCYWEISAEEIAVLNSTLASVNSRVVQDKRDKLVSLTGLTDKTNRM